jgi:hypothetical protein
VVSRRPHATVAMASSYFKIKLTHHRMMAITQKAL